MIVRNREESFLRCVCDRIATLDAAHDGDMPVPETVYVEVPCSIEQQVNASASILQCRMNEVHVLTDRGADGRC